MPTYRTPNGPTTSPGRQSAPPGMPETNAPAALGAALDWVRRGWTPVPTCRPSPKGGCQQHGRDCGEPGKRPLISWVKPRYTAGMGLPPLIEQPPSPDEIRLWFQCWPLANLALIIPAGKFVLDIDGDEGRETAYYLGLGNVDAPTDKTPNNGAHLFFVGDAPRHALLGPGLEILGPGHLVHVPPSERYSTEFGFDDVDWGIWPSTAPPLAQGGVRIEGAGFWRDAIETALTANGYNPDGPDDVDSDALMDPVPLRRVMLAIEASGAPEGRRFFTLRGLLRWLVDTGADADTLEERGRAFGERCQPPYDAAPLVKCAQRLAEWWDERRGEEAEVEEAEAASTAQAGGGAHGKTDARFLYVDTDPGIQEPGISFTSLNHWRLLWEEGAWRFALEGPWGTLAATQEACLAHNKVFYEDGSHETAGAAACADPFHEGHQPRSLYQLRASNDSKRGYPGLPERMAIYGVTKPISLEEAARGYRPRLEELKQEVKLATGRSGIYADLRSLATKELPLSRVMESSLPNAVTRFHEKAKEQGKRLYQYHKSIEYRGDCVVVEEYLLGDAGVDWGRMKGIELLAEGDKSEVISVFTDPDGLGQGGWSRSRWPEALAEAVVEALESHDGRKGRTQAGWFPGARELMEPPPAKKCPECGDPMRLVGPVQHYHKLEGPIQSEVTGKTFFRVRDTRRLDAKVVSTRKRRQPAWMRTPDPIMAGD